MLIYIVKHGESLYSISKKFHVETEQIVSLNKLGPAPYLLVGQSLIIPNDDIGVAESKLSRKKKPVVTAFIETNTKLAELIINEAGFTMDKICSVF